MTTVPFDITFHPTWWHKYGGIDFSQPFFDDPRYRIDCDIRMRRCLYDHFGAYGIGEKSPQPRPLIGTDLLAAGYLLSEIMGCQIVYQPDNSPQVKCKNLDVEAVGRLCAPDLDDDPVWARVQKQIDWLLEHYGRVEPYLNLQGVQNIALDLMGQELFLAYYSEPDEMNALLAQLTKLSIDVGRRCYSLCPDISGGVTAIVRQIQPECYLTSNCSVEMVSNAIYEEFLLPCDTELAKAFPFFGIHHCGKTMEHVCNGYSKVPNLTFAEVGAGSNLDYVRKCFPTLLLNARYSAVNLMSDTPEQIVAMVQKLLRIGKAEEGKLTISCVGIDANVPEEHILAFLTACKNGIPAEYPGAFCRKTDGGL
ncbi:MAG: uroporphyrinogen decarboxylase family protein [Clostridia bacterium]